MRNKIAAIGFVILLTGTIQLKAHYNMQGTTSKRCFVGSTLFMLGNFNSKNSPGFVQFNFGNRISGKEVVSLELETCKYSWSPGIPYGNSLAITHRPHHTAIPASIKQVDDKWSKFFWGEPGLHFRFNF